MSDQQITVETRIAAPRDAVWQAFTTPEGITQWNFASDDWQCPHAEVDLREGGRHTARMEAKDGSMGFDFGGTYREVDPQNALLLEMDDGRLSRTAFAEEDDGITHVTTTFDADDAHPAEMQRAGWQAILDNFRAYVERSRR